MIKTKIDCYCDASTDPLTKLSVIAFKIKNYDIKHHVLENTSNTDAEMIGVKCCIKYCKKKFDMNTNIANIYTDCQKAVNTIEENNFNIIKIKGHQPTICFANTQLC